MRLPLFVDLSGRRVLVVGGGAVALRRARALADAGADVLLVAPTVSGERDPRVRHEPRAFDEGDLDGMALAVACTDDPGVNAAVVAAAERRGVWAGRADDADASPLWFAAAGAVDDVQVAVSAGGDPRRAQALRDEAVAALHDGRWRARRGRRPAAGKVVLVGGGPGDPGLLTLAGYRALLDADVVVTDRLAPTELTELLTDDIEVVDVAKHPRGPAAVQEDINALVVDRAKAGNVVVRLKGGDPFVLGRGGEEVDACVAAGVAVEVIPGVSSVTAAATLAGVPLTRRGVAQHFTVASGHLPPGHPQSSVDWGALAGAGGTLVLLMAVENLAAIAAALLEGGREPATPAVVVQNASLASQRTVPATLATVAAAAAEAGVTPPAVVVIGAVAAATS